MLNGSLARAVREVLGISQAQLAARCGIDGAYLSRIEAGLRQPNQVLARRVADELLMAANAQLVTHVAASDGDDGDGEAA